MDCPLFWEAVKNRNHPKHKLALTAVQNTRNRQAENDLNKKETPSSELVLFKFLTIEATNDVYCAVQ